MRGASRVAFAEARDRLTAAWRDRIAAATLGDELFAVAHLLDREPGLRRALTDSTSPRGGQDRPGRAICWRPGLRGHPAIVVAGHGRRRAGRSPRDLADAAEQLGVLATAAAAEGAGNLDDVEDELFRFGRIVSGEPDCSPALADPAAAGRRASARCWTRCSRARWPRPRSA